MTTQITGLGSAQQFAAGMAAAHTGAIAHTESFRASVTTAGVTGDAVTAADRAAAAQADAAAAWQRAHAALLEQDRVAEAYAANPDAGSREFLTEAGGGPASTSSSRPSLLPEDRVTQPPLPDPLRLAGRIQLASGEQFAGSGSLRDSEGFLLLAAAVDTPDGRQIHVGVPIDPEEKKWRGGHAPAQETELDEGEEYSVDTGADTTVILDAADVARLGEVVDDLVAGATAADKEYRQVVKDVDRLYDARSQLEAQRFGTQGDAQRKMDLDAQLKRHEKYQKSRRATMDDAAAHLPAGDLAEYDAIQAQLDAAGYHYWEPGQEERAAAACGLSRAEFGELMALKRIPERQLSRDEQDRLRELAPYFGPPSPLHERQQALICGLTVEELRELQVLEKIPKRKRYPSQQARIDELDNSPRGATAGSPKKTYRMRGPYCSYQEAHHSQKAEYAGTLANLAALEATAQPLSDADATQLAQLTADLDAANARWEELAGEVTASAEIPGRRGDALVVEAVQREEEGGVDYRLDYKPADADNDWYASSNGDPYTTTPSGLRKIAALLGKLAG